MIFFLFISRSTFFHIWMHFFALDRGQSSWICLLTKTTIQLNHNAHNQQLPALRYPTSLKLLWLSIYMLECSLCTWIIVLPFYFPSNIVIGVYRLYFRHVYLNNICSNHGSLLFRPLLFSANVTPTKICQATKNLDETHLVGGVEDICHTELAPKHHTRNMENKMIWKTVWFSSNMDRMMGVIACRIHSCTNMYPLFLLFLFTVLSPDFCFVLHKIVML